MSETGILGAFESHAFLANLSRQHLFVLASGVKPFTVEKDNLLVKEGTNANAFFLIQSGRVAIEIHRPPGRAIAIQTIGPGEIVGWSWIVPGRRWQFDGRALDTVQGLVFDANWLREKCEQDHELGYHLLRQLVTVIASRLSATRLQLGTSTSSIPCP
jgi:CRP-like cAMP-binding protein